MKRIIRFRFWTPRTIVGLCAAFLLMSSVLAQPPLSEKALSGVAVVLVGDGEGVVTRIAPAVAVKPGVFLVPNHVLKEAKELQIRLKSGEIFDELSLIGSDERRDVAAIRVDGTDISVSEPIGTDELKAEDKLVLVTHSPEKLWFLTPARFTGTKLADEVEGAGQGYRVMQFGGELAVGFDGGVVFAENGRPVGLMTREVAVPINAGFAVPISTVSGLANGDRRRSFGSGKALQLPTEASLRSARNPSSDPKDLFLSSKKVYVNSRTTFFKEQQLINEIKKRQEIKDWGWILITDSWDARNKADLVIEIDHQILTFNFTYTITHRRSSVVISSGKVIIADGASGAPKMVDRIIKNLGELVGQKPAIAK